jgi:hypothetical protein
MSLLVRRTLPSARDAARAKAVDHAFTASDTDGYQPDAWPGCAPVRNRQGIFPACSNLQCRSGWLHLWRRREVPVFEGGWCCSAACTAAQVKAALAREMEARGSARESHRHRIPLGLAMLEQGWITQEQLRAALGAQRAAGTGKLGGWLVRQRSVTEEQVTRALGLQWGSPVLGLEFHNREGLTALVPRLFVDAFGALPLRVAAGKILYLGFEDRLDPALALAVERMTGLHVESGLVRGSEFRPAHARLLEARFPAVELVEAATEPALAAVLAKTVERATPVETRLVRVHDCLWLRMWLGRQSGPLPELGSVRDLIASTGAH